MDFEARMRATVKELVEPVVKRADYDRANIS